MLGIVTEGCSIVFLWDLNSKKMVEVAFPRAACDTDRAPMQMESNMKELSWLKWSDTTSQVAMSCLCRAQLCNNR